MASIRLSPDVEQAAQQLSEEMGLGSVRTAIEAVFRTKWQDYRSGCGCKSNGPTPVPDEPINAAMALDDVL
ncbi:MAG: hypothetical protein O2890_13940 [Cyanobacteria bacterium]|nr:hypothetical protein [Cyanobacteriota bacterium]MDA0867480.1 hypothetical protein [Cyanobacteriota bacterium]